MTASVVEVPLFIKKHDLTGLLKTLEKANKESVALLVKTMEDENQPIKVRLDCANALLGYNISVADMISKDQITRQISELKANGKVGRLGFGGNDDDKPEAPRLDMTTIQNV